MNLLALTACCVDYYPQIDRSSVGGNSLNVAAMWKRMDTRADISVVTRLGMDLHGKMIHDFFSGAGINTSYVYLKQGDTASNRLRVDEYGERHGIEGSWNGGVNEGFLLSEFDWERVSQQNMVAIPANDPNFSSMIDRQYTGLVLSVDYLDMENGIPLEETIDQTHMAFIAGRSGHLPYLRDLAFTRKRLLVVTLGAGGSYGFHRGKEYFQPALEVPRVTDTTGCGDAYQAAFALTWITTGNMRDSMRAGAEAASEVAQIWGGVAGLYESMSD